MILLSFRRISTVVLTTDSFNVLEVGTCMYVHVHVLYNVRLATITAINLLNGGFICTRTTSEHSRLKSRMAWARSIHQKLHFE